MFVSSPRHNVSKRLVELHSYLAAVAQYPQLVIGNVGTLQCNVMSITTQALKYGC